MPMSWSVLAGPPLVLTCIVAVLLVMYFVSKRAIFRQVAMVFLLITTIMWIGPVLIALGVYQRPIVRERHDK